MPLKAQQGEDRPGQRVWLYTFALDASKSALVLLLIATRAIGNGKFLARNNGVGGALDDSDYRVIIGIPIQPLFRREHSTHGNCPVFGYLLYTRRFFKGAIWGAEIWITLFNPPRTKK